MSRLSVSINEYIISQKYLKEAQMEKLNNGNRCAQYTGCLINLYTHLNYLWQLVV
jgi:hypothetical protein